MTSVGMQLNLDHVIYAVIRSNGSALSPGIDFRAECKTVVAQSAQLLVINMSFMINLLTDGTSRPIIHFYATNASWPDTAAKVPLAGEFGHRAVRKR